MGTISKTLQTLIDADRGVRQVPVHVMLEADVGPSDAEALLAEIHRHVADPAAMDYLRHMRIALCTVTLDSVEAINGLPGVASIDLDSAAPLDELLDAKG